MLTLKIIMCVILIIALIFAVIAFNDANTTNRLQ